MKQVPSHMLGMPHAKFSEKFVIHVISIKDNASRINAYVEYAKLTGMSTKAAKYVCSQLPQLLCTSGCETFESIVLNVEEANMALSTLSDYFEMDIHSAKEQVLPYGMTMHLPWENQATPVA